MRVKQGPAYPEPAMWAGLDGSTAACADVDVPALMTDDERRLDRWLII
jgi:hypothetical protein